MKLILLLTMISLHSGNSEAREKIGNGGGGFACKNKDGEVQTAYLLDLFEGSLPLYPRTVGYHYPEVISTIDNEVSRAIERASVNPEFAAELANAIQTVRTSIMLLPKPAQLEYTEDAFPEVKMKDCEFVQIANYVLEDGRQHRVDIVNEFYSKMSTLHQAGLIVHEAVYALARKYSLDQSSTRARRITAMLLSDERLDQLIQFESSDLIAPAFNLEYVLNLLNDNPKALISVEVSVEGQSSTQGVIVALNSAEVPVKTTGTKVSRIFLYSSAELRSFHWTYFNGSDAKPYYFTITVRQGGKVLFKIAKRTVTGWNSEVLKIR